MFLASCEIINRMGIRFLIEHLKRKEHTGGLNLYPFPTLPNALAVPAPFLGLFSRQALPNPSQRYRRSGCLPGHSWELLYQSFPGSRLCPVTTLKPLRAFPEIWAYIEFCEASCNDL